MANYKKNVNFQYADAGEASSDDTVENQASTASGELPTEEDVDNTEFAGVKSVEQSGISGSDRPSGGSYPAGSRLAR